MDDAQGYLEQNQEAIEAYLAFRASPDFHQSEAAQLQRAMLDFQRVSGYEERFLGPLERLSPTYRAYRERLCEANEVFLRRFPDAEEKLGLN